METNIKYIHTPDVHNLNAPEKVVPILIELFKPNSVLDVGCGLGTWLSVFSAKGITDILGIDGDFVDLKLLEQYIKKSDFKPFDLIYPFDLQRNFDLVISLEVAEHLPETSAIGFVESLCRHSNKVVFSAAIPGQGGQNHLNEQWKKYWIEKFAVYNFKPFDLIRPRIWNLQEVDWWYKQNIIVFSNKDLSNLIDTSSGILDAIHPELFHQNLEYITYLMDYAKDLEAKVYEFEMNKVSD